MTCTVLAPAKINLTLDVTGRRADGYHLVDTVMQSIDCADRITIRLTEAPGITLRLSDPALPADARNTAHRAAAAFFRAVPGTVGADIFVEKRIPQQAGMAGGSADAAGVLVGLNHLLQAGLSMEELCRLGAEIGADVPFCIRGGTARGTGIGTELAAVPPFPAAVHILVAKPAGGVSTAEAYRRIDEAELSARPSFAAMHAALQAGSPAAIGRAMGNVFEEAIALPETATIHRVMRDTGACGCQMTGSGSAFFGLYERPEDARRGARLLAELCPVTMVCAPCATGPWLE